MKVVKNGLGIAGSIFLYTFIVAGILPLIFHKNPYSSADQVQPSITEVSLLGCLMAGLFYAYVLFVLRKNNAIFVARCALCFLGIYLIIQFITLLLKCTGFYLVIMPGLLIIAFLCVIKGILITYSDNAQKLFPISQRKAKYIDIMFFALCAYLIVIPAYLEYKDDSQPQATETINAKGIVGQWESTIQANKGECYVYFNIYSDGTAEMGGNNTWDDAKKMKLDNVKWSQNGNLIYLYTKEQAEVGVMEILSLNKNSLVIHYRGEPEKETIFFTRKQ